MELLLVLCLCISTWTGKTLGDENDIQRLHTPEGSDIILPHSLLGKNLTRDVFDWKKDDVQEVFFYDKGSHYNNGLGGQNENFKTRVDFFQDELQFGNASIRIKNTKLTDSGIYSCTFPKLQPGKNFYIELVVDCTLKDRRKERPDACPKPKLSTDDKSFDAKTLKCSVPSASKVEMELHKNYDSTVVQPHHRRTSSDSQEFIFSVTQQGEYRCLVKQTEYCHQLYSDETLRVIYDTKNRAEGQKKIKLILLLLLVVVNLLLP